MSVAQEHHHPALLFLILGIVVFTATGFRVMRHDIQYVFVSRERRWR